MGLGIGLRAHAGKSLLTRQPAAQADCRSTLQQRAGACPLLDWTHPLRPSPLRCPAVKVEMDVLVHSEAVKKIVVGAGGAQIAAIRSAAQAELQEAWGHPVHLFLRVRVEKVA